VDLPAILKALDADIEKLYRVRDIIAGLEQPAQTRKKKPRRKPLPSSAEHAAEPVLVRLPPKVKREYRPPVKPLTPVPMALAPVSSDRPVLVPRAELPAPEEQSEKSADFNPGSLSSPVENAAEPVLVRLPPKVKREYRPRVKRLSQVPMALAPASSDRPVFVPRTALSTPIEPSQKSTDYNPELLEATFRKNLSKRGPLSQGLAGS